MDDAAESARRFTAARSAMGSFELDGLVCGDSGEWLLPTGNARYFSNFTIGNMPGALGGSVAVLPADGEPILVVPYGPQDCFRDWAQTSAWIPTVLSSPPEDPSGPLVPSVADAIRQAGLSRARIGIAGTFPGIKSLTEAFPSAEFVSTAAGNPGERDVVEQIRSVKSDWEVHHLRNAQTAAEAGMASFFDEVHPEVRLAEAVAVANLAAVRAGAEASRVILSAGTPWLWWHVQSERRFQAGDLVSLETNARSRGYTAQYARSTTLGEATELQSRLLAAARDSIDAMVAAARPGVTGAQVWQRGMEPVHEAGLTAWGRLGHGMGLSMDEGIAIVPDEQHRLEVGNCVALHASVWEESTRQSVILGEQYLIEAERPVPLSSQPQPHHTPVIPAAADKR